MKAAWLFVALMPLLAGCEINVDFGPTVFTQPAATGVETKQITTATLKPDTPAIASAMPVPTQAPSASPTMPPTPTLPVTPTLPPASPLPACTQTGQRWFSPMDGMPVMCVPAGKFLMGASDADIQKILALCVECKSDWFADAQPQNEIILDAFWIDQTEVTNGMYARCVNAGACQPPTSFFSGEVAHYYDDAQYNDYPVLWAGWTQANAYCTWTGRRLPSETEWEKAARGPDGRFYPWGEEIDCQKASYSKVMGGCVSNITRAGSYPDGASPYGALDMAGNAREWVADWYDEGYYAVSPLNNPPGPADGYNRVVRGGDWIGHAWEQAVMIRMDNYPEMATEYGFRCAISSP